MSQLGVSGHGIINLSGDQSLHLYIYISSVTELVGNV